MGRRPSGKLLLAADGQKLIQMRRYTVSSLYTLLVKFGGKKKKPVQYHRDCFEKESFSLV